MEHLVRFKTAEGRDGFHVADSLEDALQFVEHLRNNEEAPLARVYRMQEVPIEFRTYYKVELKTGEVPMEPPPPPEAEAGNSGPEPPLQAVSGGGSPQGQ